MTKLLKRILLHIIQNIELLFWVSYKLQLYYHINICQFDKQSMADGTIKSHYNCICNSIFWKLWNAFLKFDIFTSKGWIKILNRRQVAVHYEFSFCIAVKQEVAGSASGGCTWCTVTGHTLWGVRKAPDHRRRILPSFKTQLDLKDYLTI